jgi:hypothetical protein
VLGSERLYKQDLKIDELEKQQGVVAQYLDTVDEVLFGGGKGDVRGWASEQERLAHREKGRRPGVPTPDSDFSASPAEALGFVGVVESMQDLAVTEEQDALETLCRRRT